MSGPTINAWRGVVNRQSHDDSTVHAGFQQGKNPLLAHSLATMMAMSPHFAERLAGTVSSVVTNRI